MIFVGDNLPHLRAMADNSVDAIVTDPPYGLSFMGKKWDYDVPSVELWAECLRVLKPGGHLLAFAGTRTQHRMAVRIEDAGFEIRDMIAWLYGSGFPKSLDVSKAIDKSAGAQREVIGYDPFAAKRTSAISTNAFGDYKGQSGDVTAPATEAARQWEGWGTALKPAMEPITVARKPLIGTVAANVLTHGTGALNIDECRVGNEARHNPSAGNAPGGNSLNMSALGMPTNAEGRDVAGRWPANVIHDGSEEVLAAFPGAPRQLAVASHSAPPSKTRNTYGERGRRPGGFGNVGADKGDPIPCGPMYSDKGSAARFFYCAKASKVDRNEGCDTLPERQAGPLNMRTDAHAERTGATTAPQSNNHPTVKPTALMRYLCRLVTPPGGLVLDPFVGSGSTGKAAALEGFRFIGIEQDPAFAEIAKTREAHAIAAYLDGAVI